MTDSNVLWNVGKQLTRFFRRQPLKELAIALSFWTPISLVLRMVAAREGIEALIDQAVAPWAIQVTAAGLAYVSASSFVAIATQLKAGSRRRLFAHHRQDAINRREAQRGKKLDEIRLAISALTDEDRQLLGLFVKHRQHVLPIAIAQKNAGAASRLDGLGYIYRSDEHSQHGEVVLMDGLFAFLLAHPELLGLSLPATLSYDDLSSKITALRTTRA